MICNNCGLLVSDGTKFCQKCGYELKAVENNAGLATAREDNTPRWETISIEVDNMAFNNYYFCYYCNDINHLIKDYEAFGWEVKNNQTIKNKDSHLERRGDSIYSVTESDDISVITFRRNKKMKNYTEINNLFREYTQVLDNWPPVGNSRMNTATLVILTLLFIPAGIVYYLYKKSQEKDINENEKRSHESAKHIEELIKKAENLL